MEESQKHKFFKPSQLRKPLDITGREGNDAAGDSWNWMRGDQNEGTGQARPEGTGQGGCSQPAPFRFNMGLTGARKPK